jgi:hypothetical protein
VLQRIPDDVARENIQNGRRREEKRITQEQFQLLLEKDQEKLDPRNMRRKENQMRDTRRK